ncbi:MAG TPA: hypothetical protein VFR49_05960, partial [Solirubrobacteraceae bacterium]|nr:hypothetical protein [Solirubrobacteraceae bacterium]
MSGRARRGGPVLLVFERRRRMIRALAMTGLIFLFSTYIAPMAVAAAHTRGTASTLPKLALPTLAFPRFDSGGAVATSGSRETVARLVGSGSSDGSGDAPAPLPDAGAASGTPAPGPAAHAPDIVDNHYDLGPAAPADPKHDPFAGAPTIDSAIGGPITGPLAPDGQSHAQPALDPLAVNPLGEPSRVLAPGPVPTPGNAADGEGAHASDAGNGGV